MRLTNYTTWVKEYKDGPFDVKVGYFPEDIYVGDLYDESCYDIEDMARKIDMGYLEWFVARVQYLYEGVEMGSAYLGGCLYDDAEKAIEEGLDGYLEDMTDEAKTEAMDYLTKLYEKMSKDLVDNRLIPVV